MSKFPYAESFNLSHNERMDDLFKETAKKISAAVVEAYETNYARQSSLSFEEFCSLFDYVIDTEPTDEHTLTYTVRLVARRRYETPD